MCMLMLIVGSEFPKAWYESIYCLCMLRDTFSDAVLKMLAAGG